VDVDFIQVTGPQRIPTLLSGRADIAISSLSMTIDRAKVVMFASPHGALSIVIAAPASVDIKDAKGMSGKRIGITRATLEEATVPKIAPPDARIVLFDDIAATIQALLSGQVDAAGFSAFTSKSRPTATPIRSSRTSSQSRRRTTPPRSVPATTTCCTSSTPGLRCARVTAR